MRRILVPTDFSENAQAAFLYALELAEQLQASVSVVHVYHPSAHHINEWMVTSDEELVKLSNEKLEKFVQSNFSKSMEDVVVADMIDQQLVPGFAAETLVNLSQSGDYDLIVMGSTGSSGFLEKVFGKVSSYVSQHSACPVLLIPNGTEFQDINNIMYAGDYESANESVLLQFGDCVSQLNAKIHIVHVHTQDQEGKKDFGHYLLEKVFMKKAPELQFEMHTIESDTVAHGLQDFADEKEIDWMVIVKAQRKFWDRLTHKSATNELIRRPNIPMLVLH